MAHPSYKGPQGTDAAVPRVLNAYTWAHVHKRCAPTSMTAACSLLAHRAKFPLTSLSSKHCALHSATLEQVLRVACCYRRLKDFS